MDKTAQLNSRYEALFRALDGLRGSPDVESLFRVLPLHLEPVLDFDYISVFFNEGAVAGPDWYVLDDVDRETLTTARYVPVEEAQVSWSVENQRPAVVHNFGEDKRFPDASRLLIDRGFRSGHAVPMTTPRRRIGAMFLGSEQPCTCSDEELRFLSLVAHRLALTIDDLIEENRSSQAPITYSGSETVPLDELTSTSRLDDIVGSSKQLDRILCDVNRVAPTYATVLITGESGTGKELIARAIHERSNRSNRPFVRVNCCAIPPSLIASELFGYEKGAFTGACQRHLGRFELANSGTIFLDEIGEIPQETQIALLRVLQEREFERIGGTHSIPVDVRVLAATNRDLQGAVKAGTFRLDLFYRINVFPIALPSLRERIEDIPSLVAYFIKRYAAPSTNRIRNIERETLHHLQAYDWPGNIRELQNVVERAMILCDSETFSIGRSWLRPVTRTGSRSSVPLGSAIENREREMIEDALEESRGRVSGPEGAAGKLGMARTTLESKIKSLGINKHRYASA